MKNKKIIAIINCFIFLILILFFCNSSNIVTADSDGVILTVNSTECAVDDEVEIGVQIENPMNTAGGDVTITYDPDLIELKDVRSSRRTGGAIFMPNLDYDKNMFRVVWVRTTGLQRGGEIAIISFKARKSGETTFKITDVSLSDEDGLNVDVSDLVDGEIIIKDSADSAVSEGERSEDSEGIVSEEYENDTDREEDPDSQDTTAIIDDSDAIEDTIDGDSEVAADESTTEMYYLWWWLIPVILIIIILLIFFIRRKVGNY